jgi:osmotically-inducible protein OsmY
MGWVNRLFGQQEQAQVAATAVSTGKTWAEINNQPEAATPSNEPIAPERVGLHGEYDQSGLAKRVALAFDQDPTLDDINTVYVFQTGGTVVLKGKAPSQAIISKMVAVAKTVSGATAVETNEITVG